MLFKKVLYYYSFIIFGRGEGGIFFFSLFWIKLLAFFGAILWMFYYLLIHPLADLLP